MSLREELIHAIEIIAYSELRGYEKEPSERARKMAIAAMGAAFVLLLKGRGNKDEKTNGI